MSAGYLYNGTKGIGLSSAMYAYSGISGGGFIIWSSSGAFTKNGIILNPSGSDPTEIFLPNANSVYSIEVILNMATAANSGPSYITLFLSYKTTTGGNSYNTQAYEDYLTTNVGTTYNFTYLHNAALGQYIKFQDISNNPMTFSTNIANSRIQINEVSTASGNNNLGSVNFTTQIQNIYTTNASIDYAMGTGDFTMECWIYSTQTTYSGNVVIMSTGQTTGGTVGREIGIYASMNNGNIGIVYPNTNSTTNIALSSNVAVIPNVWYHFALVRNGLNLTLYINGIDSAATWTTLNHIGQGAANVGQFWVNNSSSTGGNGIIGYISNVRLVKGTAVYTANFAVPTSPLTVVTNTNTKILLNTIYPTNGNYTDSGPNATVMTSSYNIASTNSAYFNPFITQPSGSINFTLTSAYIQTAPNVNYQMSNQDFTMECWVYSTQQSYNNYNTILSTGFTGPGDYIAIIASWFINGNANAGLGIVFPVNSTSNLVQSTTLLPYNTWCHLSLIRNINALTLYLNGSSIIATTMTDTHTATDPVACVNQVSGGFGNGILGYTSNVRIIKGTAMYPSSIQTFNVPIVPLDKVTNTVLLLKTVDPYNNFYDDVNNVYISHGVNSVGSNFNPFNITSGSINFTANTQSIRTPASSNFAVGTGNFTMECFVYITGLTLTSGWSIPILSVGIQNSEMRLMAGLGGTTSNFGFLYPNTSNTGYLYTAVNSGTPVVLNTWYHLALVRNGLNIKLYINGIASGSTLTLTSSTDVNITSVNSVLYVNADPFTFSNSADYGITGNISNVRFIKGTPAYTSNFNVPIVPLLPVTNTQLLMNTVYPNNYITDSGPNVVTMTTTGITSANSAVFNPFV